MSFSNVTSSGYGRRRSSPSSFPTSPQPKSVLRPKHWDENVEEAYRFQVAGYRDEREYMHLKDKNGSVDRWPANGFVKKLQRKDGTYYYYSKSRECKEKDVNRTKLYAY